jgi:hypothetical protein
LVTGPQTLILDLTVNLEDGTVATVQEVRIPIPSPSKIVQRVQAEVNAL